MNLDQNDWTSDYFGKGLFLFSFLTAIFVRNTSVTISKRLTEPLRS